MLQQVAEMMYRGFRSIENLGRQAIEGRGPPGLEVLNSGESARIKDYPRDHTFSGATAARTPVVKDTILACPCLSLNNLKL